MAISIEDIKKLRSMTGAGLADVKKALTEAEGDFDKAKDLLRERGLAIAAKRSDRETSNGCVLVKCVPGFAAMVAVKCETDFVARTDNFKGLAHELAMQIAAMRPKWVSQDDIPEAERTRKREELVASAKADPKNANKPAEILDKIIDGQLNKYFSELVLLDQTYWKDDSKTIGTLVKEEMAKLGENIVVRRFARLELGVSED